MKIELVNHADVSLVEECRSILQEAAQEYLQEATVQVWDVVNRSPSVKYRLVVGFENANERENFRSMLTKFMKNRLPNPPFEVLEISLESPEKGELVIQGKWKSQDDMMSDLILYLTKNFRTVAKQI